jgi:hypothetical protein
MREYYSIYHRPTDTWATWFPLSKYCFKSSTEYFPKLLDTSTGGKRIMTNFVKYCNRYFKPDLEFCLGLELVKVTPSFSQGEVFHKQIFSLEKI